MGAGDKGEEEAAMGRHRISTVIQDLLPPPPPPSKPFFDFPCYSATSRFANYLCGLMVCLGEGGGDEDAFLCVPP